jgi:hypothetical protein
MRPIPQAVIYPIMPFWILVTLQVIGRVVCTILKNRDELLDFGFVNSTRN